MLQMWRRSQRPTTECYVRKRTKRMRGGIIIDYSIPAPLRLSGTRMTIRHPTTSPRRNRLLAAMADPDFERIAEHLEFAPLELGEVLYESGARMEHAYFPTTSIVSLLYVMSDGASAEIAMVGNDGIVGVALLMGGESTPSRAVAQSAGDGYRLNSKVLMEEFRRYGPTAHLLLRYTQALITQMAQTAVCNRHHAVDQQLCRWLLLSLDRLPSIELRMTQELISNMLGVRREGVTEAAGKLQAAGLIDYSRGRIRVLDRQGLEARVCECYRVVRRETDRLLPSPRRARPNPWSASTADAPCRHIRIAGATANALVHECDPRRRHAGSSRRPASTIPVSAGAVEQLHRPSSDLDEADCAKPGEQAAYRLELQAQVAADFGARHAQHELPRRISARPVPLRQVEQEHRETLVGAHRSQHRSSSIASATFSRERSLTEIAPELVADPPDFVDLVERQRADVHILQRRHLALVRVDGDAVDADDLAGDVVADDLVVPVAGEE